jgi:methyl-accepting chemotaxis protein
MAFSQVREHYERKLAIGYAVVMVYVVAVAVVTGEALGTAVAAVSGLLALGSITGATSLATLNQLERQATAIAEGDLDTEVSSPRVDQFGSVAGAIEEMRVSLTEEIEESSAAEAAAREEKARAETVATQHVEIAESYAETVEAIVGGGLERRVSVQEVSGSEGGAFSDGEIRLLGQQQRHCRFGVHAFTSMHTDSYRGSCKI